MIRYQSAIISLYFDLLFACVKGVYVCVCVSVFANSKSFIIGDNDNNKCVIMYYHVYTHSLA